MSPGEINAAIGEALGGCACGRATDHKGYCHMGRNYVKDLNAMHYAEQSFGSHEQGRYSVILSSLVPKSSLMGVSAFDVLHASAALRAKAWLMTVGIWQRQKILEWNSEKPVIQIEG